MMRNIFFLLFIIPLLSSCTLLPSRKTGKLLKEVASIVEQQPDSAYALLQTILYPADLRASQYHQYVLLLLQAKDKSYHDISGDTLIFATKDYYVKNNDFENAALSAFYCGNVLLEQGQYEKAIAMYLEAEHFAESTENNNLKGLIQSNLGFIDSQHFLNKDAIVHAKNAITFYEKVPNYKKEIHALRMIGNGFLLENQNDSAFYYYNQALTLAETHQLIKEQTNIRNSIGVAYREIGNYKYATKSLQEALSLSSDSTEQARILMNLAKTYYLEDKIDSAKYCIHLSLAIGAKDAGLTRSTYYFLFQLEEKEGDCDLALQYHKTYTEQVSKVIEANKNAALLELQTKYNFETLKNDNMQLIVKQQKMLLIAVFVLLLIGLIAFVFYRKSIQNQKFLDEAYQKIDALNRMAEYYSKEKDSLQNTFKNTLFSQFNVLKKVALINRTINEKDTEKNKHFINTFNKIVYKQDQLDWNLFYKTMNEMHNGFYDQLRNQYPQLDETEFNICCLSCEKFDDTDITILLGLSLSNIRNKRCAIRKKIGIDAFARFDTFFNKQSSKKVQKKFTL